MAGDLVTCICGSEIAAEAWDAFALRIDTRFEA
jgi:hypothetical protein